MAPDRHPLDNLDVTHQDMPPRQSRVIDGNGVAHAMPRLNPQFENALRETVRRAVDVFMIRAGEQFQQSVNSIFDLESPRGVPYMLEPEYPHPQGSPRSETLVSPLHVEPSRVMKHGYESGGPPFASQTEPSRTPYQSRAPNRFEEQFDASQHRPSQKPQHSYEAASAEQQYSPSRQSHAPEVPEKVTKQDRSKDLETQRLPPLEISEAIETATESGAHHCPQEPCNQRSSLSEPNLAALNVPDVSAQDTDDQSAGTKKNKSFAGSSTAASDHDGTTAIGRHTGTKGNADIDHEHENSADDAQSSIHETSHAEPERVTSPTPTTPKHSPILTAHISSSNKAPSLDSPDQTPSNPPTSYAQAVTATAHDHNSNPALPKVPKAPGYDGKSPAPCTPVLRPIIHLKPNPTGIHHLTSSPKEVEKFDKFLTCGGCWGRRQSCTGHPECLFNSNIGENTYYVMCPHGSQCYKQVGHPGLGGQKPCALLHPAQIARAEAHFGRENGYPVLLTQNGIPFIGWPFKAGHLMPWNPRNLNGWGKDGTMPLQWIRQTFMRHTMMPMEDLTAYQQDMARLTAANQGSGPRQRAFSKKVNDTVKVFDHNPYDTLDFGDNGRDELGETSSPKASTTPVPESPPSFNMKSPISANQAKKSEAKRQRDEQREREAKVADEVESVMTAWKKDFTIAKKHVWPEVSFTFDEVYKHSCVGDNASKIAAMTYDPAYSMALPPGALPTDGWKALTSMITAYVRYEHCVAWAKHRSVHDGITRSEQMAAVGKNT